MRAIPPVCASRVLCSPCSRVPPLTRLLPLSGALPLPPSLMQMGPQEGPDNPRFRAPQSAASRSGGGASAPGESRGGEGDVEFIPVTEGVEAPVRPAEHRTGKVGRQHEKKLAASFLRGAAYAVRYCHASPTCTVDAWHVL